MGLMIWRKAAVYALVALPAMGLAGFGLWAQQQQQDSSQQSTGDPVADAARKAREQKKKQEAVKPKRVYTDEDVNHSTSETQAATGTAGAEGGGKTGAAQAGPGSGKPEDSPEKTWRKRFKE